MTPATLSWSEHLHRLPELIQSHAQQMRQRLREALAQLGAEPLASFIFLPEQTDHPEFADAAQVFDQAVSQWVVQHMLSPHEAPLLYLGYDTVMNTADARMAQGFVLTDQALYAQDDYSVIGKMPAPRVYALPRQEADIPSFLAYATGRFAWEDWAQLSNTAPPSLREQVIFVLQHAIQAILAYHQQHCSQLRLQAMPMALSPFIAEHDLHSTLLLGEDPGSAKKLGKVARQLGIPQHESLHLALVAFVWFGLLRGLAMTDQALYTRDLMQAPIRIPLEKVDPASLRYSDDGKEMRLNGNLPLFLPRAFESSLQGELRSLLQQEIQILITAQSSPKGYLLKTRRQA